MELLFVCLVAHDSEFRRWLGGVDHRKCQTFAASPAEPGELPLGFSGDPDWGSGRLARQSVRSSLDLTIAGAGPTPHRRRWIFCQASERAHADLFGWGWADLQLGTGEQYISPSVDLGGQNLLSDGILSSMELRIALTVGGLSVLSGLFDLLPVPPPDGGRLVLLAVEALRGRTVSSQA